MAQSIPDRSMVTEISHGFLDCLFSTEDPKAKNNHMNGKAHWVLQRWILVHSLAALRLSSINPLSPNGQCLFQAQNSNKWGSFFFFSLCTQCGLPKDCRTNVSANVGKCFQPGCLWWSWGCVDNGAPSSSGASWFVCQRWPLKWLAF